MIICIYIIIIMIIDRLIILINFMILGKPFQLNVLWTDQSYPEQYWPPLKLFIGFDISEMLQIYLEANYGLIYWHLFICRKCSI